MSSPILTTVTRRVAVTTRGAFALPVTRRALYSSHSSMHENNPDKLHNHKHISLKEQKDGKGQWHEDLASDSEAFIKAEREEIKATGEEIKKLQEETTTLLKKAGIK